jgi:hypothetical protein
VPVRIEIDHEPVRVRLVAGMMATEQIDADQNRW